jgi:hypothetical protein
MSKGLKMVESSKGETTPEFNRVLLIFFFTFKLSMGLEEGIETDFLDHGLW